MDRFKAFEISAMEGRKITHRYFTDEEYIEILPNGKIRTEEGYIVGFDEFMSYRKENYWETDWRIFE